MSTIRVGGRDVRVSLELMSRLKKTPKSQVKTTRDRILKWAGDAGPPKPVARPRDPTPGKAIYRRAPGTRKPFNPIPAHVLFRKHYPIDRG